MATFKGLLSFPLDLRNSSIELIIRKTLQRQCQKPFSFPTNSVLAHNTENRKGLVPYFQPPISTFDHIRGIQQTKLDFIQTTRSSWDLYKKTRARKFYLRADHLTSWRRLSEEKNCMQHKCNRKLMGKKGKKNILPTRLLEKKILDDQKSSPSLKS